MDRQRRRWTIILLLAIAIVIGSFYSSCRNKTAAENMPEYNLNIGKTAEVLVHISGEINNPGLYKLPAGSRVVDAVGLAGGLTSLADESKINLALALKDGMHVKIPPVSRKPTHSRAQAKEQHTAQRENVGKISINAADQKELERLPGIGPSLAGRIIEYRLNYGPFQDVCELKKVPGIGDVKFNMIKKTITL